MKMHDTIIIGAGIAGLTAAIYAARKKMAFELISTEFGGQFMVSGEVLNYPGIVETTGLQFRSTMEKQMGFNHVKPVLETVKEVKRAGRNFRVITDKRGYDTRSVIIATGSGPKKLGVPGEDRLAKKGVTYCSICDGPLFSGMDVAVVGSGNAALEAVDFLKDIASKIYMVIRGGRLKGHEYLQERLRKNPKVEVMYKAQIKEVLGDGFVSGVKYMQDGEEKRLDVKGLIIEVGRIPHTAPFRGILDLDEDGHIKIDCQGHTSVPGIFAAGDCASGHEYQYVISAGQGCMALIKAARYLADLK